MIQAARAARSSRPAKRGGAVPAPSATPDKPPFTLDTIKEKIQSLSSFTIGSKQFILFIGDEGAVLVLIQSGRISRRLYAPSPAPEHVHPFLELLRVNSGVPISVMLDVMDQSYVRHTFPPVSVFGIKKLVERRLDRDFSSEDIRGSMLIGRDSEGRKEWNYLLISVANSSMIQQWTETIFELPNRMLGMYLIPIEAQNFIVDLAKLCSPTPAIKAMWRLMVCHDKVSGYRQVVLKDNQLVFTRLTAATSDMAPDVMAAAIEQEILSTIEYLRRLSYNDQAGLEVFVIIADEVKPLIKNDRINATSMKCLSPFEVAEMMKLEQAALSGDRFADVVIASHFGMGTKRRLRLLPPYAQKLTVLYQSSFALKVATAVLLLGLVYAVVMEFFNAADVKININRAIRDKETATEEIAKAERSLSGLGAMQGEVLNVATLYGGVLQKRPLPLDFVKAMGKVVNDNRLVRSLDWRFESEAAAKARTPKTPAPQPEQAAQPEQAVEQFIVKVEVKLSGHGGDRKNFINLAYRLIGDMKAAFPNYEVEHDPLPGTTTNEESLKLIFDESGSDEYLEDNHAVVVLHVKGPKPALAEQPATPKDD